MKILCCLVFINGLLWVRVWIPFAEEYNGERCLRRVPMEPNFYNLGCPREFGKFTPIPHWECLSRTVDLQCGGGEE